jgi:hypothetical protein
VPLDETPRSATVSDRLSAQAELAELPQGDIAPLGRRQAGDLRVDGHTWIVGACVWRI